MSSVLRRDAFAAYSGTVWPILRGSGEAAGTIDADRVCGQLGGDRWTL